MVASVVVVDRVADVERRSASVSSRAKDCPDCAETILAAARVCKHCGHRFDSEEIAE